MKDLLRIESLGDVLISKCNIYVQSMMLSCHFLDV